MSSDPHVVLHAVDIGIAEVDYVGRCQFINHAGAALLGYESAALLGQPLDALVGTSPDGYTSSVPDSPIRQVLCTGQDCAAVQGLLRRRDGLFVAAELTVQALRDGARISGAVVTFRDIAARTRAAQAPQQHTQRFMALFEQAAVGIAHVAPDGRWLQVNRRLCEIVGYSEAELRERTFQDITHLDDLDTDLAYAQQLLRGEIQTYTMEKRYLRKDGSSVWINLTVSLVRDETGHPDYFISVVEDISERKRVAQNQDFLIEASAILGASLDYQTTLVNVAELAVPHIADWCMIDLVDEHGAIHRLAVAHPDPAKVEVAYQLHQRYPQSTNTPYGLPQVLRTGHPEYVEDIPDDLLVATACDAEHLATLRALKLRSYLIVPLKARERTFGAITFVAAESGRRYGATDLVLAQELARRAALAIDNAHLYAAAQQARATAERVAVRTARLQRVAAALASALTPGQVAEVVLNEGVAALRARGGVIVRLTDDATELELVGAAGYPQPVLDTWSRFPVSASLPLADAVRTNEPIIVDSFAARTARYPHLTGEQAATGNGAMASIPLLENERVVGAMGFSFDPQRTLVEEDRMFLLALARLCSQAFERARLYEAEQQAHTTAQEAMQREHQRATQLHGMANASLVINSTLSLSAMLQTVTEQARHLIGAHQAVASLTADEHWNQSINAISLSDKYAAWRTLTTPLPYGSEMYAVVCRTNTPLRMTQAELEAHPAWRNVGSEHGSYPPVHGWLAAPLIGRSGQNLGVLQLSDKYVGEFSAEDEAILVQLAHLASAAIENASLYQAAQEAVRLRDEFLSIASHELKTPITSMKLQIQTLLRAARRAGDDGVDPQRLIGKLQATERQVERLTSLVDELLDISRVAAGRLELRSEWHDLASIVRDVAARFEEELARANCILVLHADMPVEGWWDSFRLEQIITNLVSNALKYGAGHPIEVAVMAHGAQAQLVVRDHGIGIAAEDVERIFAPFERAVSSKHYGGLGLGLFIVGQITAALGGTIRVTSTPNVGSTFTIDLPRERQAAESSQR